MIKKEVAELMQVIEELVKVTKETAITTRESVKLLALFKKMHPQLLS